ncbi:MAG: BON domain-containing protein [Sphingomonadaceae bacterium]
MMESPREYEKDALAREPYPPTDTTLHEPDERGSLDDRRLADRKVGSSLADQEISGQALIALAADGRVDLGDGLDDRITVKTEGRIAILSGVVDCAGQKMDAEELVESIPGVELVQNALTVAADGYLSDEDLDEKVRARLDSSGFEWVGSRVSHGIARLMGTAQKLSDQERAVRTAADVKGIRGVVSNIKVAMPEYTDDIDLFSLASQALATNDIVVMDQEMRVVDGAVEINGKVQSLADARRIRRILSDIAGIRAVRAHLEVDHTLFRDFQARTHLSTGR